MSFEFESDYARIKYGDSGATYLRRCPICMRFVKADKSILVNGLDEIKDEPNATCKEHSRVKMPFEGYI